MEELLRRARRFRDAGYAAHADLYRRLAGRQAPHTLFIACADARVDPALLVGAAPGELFVVRNVANAVPPWAPGDDRAHERAAIEFAVVELDVERIVVLGHSNCGGCAALAEPGAIDEALPNLRAWAAATEAEGATSTEAFERANVKRQLANLRTYPCVAEREAAGTLAVSGWYLRIGTGEIFECD